MINSTHSSQTLKTPVLSLEKISYSYGKKQVLSNLSLTVFPRNIYGFLGINGAGKTTTFSLIAGYLGGYTGTIKKVGRFGILPQDSKFYSGRSVFSQMKLFARLSHVPEKKLEEEIMRVLTLVHLEDTKKMKPENLSHGMNKRLALAQALLGNPEVVLLDEPTAGLDPNNARDVKNLICELGKTATVVVSSHILTEISQMCDRVGVIHNGKMKYEGNIEELTSEKSQIQVTLSGNIDTYDWIKSIVGITEVKKDNHPKTAFEETKLILSFEKEKISLAQLNKQLFELCREKNILILELMRGMSLETGFLEMLKKN